MKQFIILLAVVMAGSVALAQKPGDVKDAVSTSIDLNLVKDLLGLAQHSKLQLEEGLRNINKVKYSERHRVIRKLIDDVIEGSDDKGQELYMRSVLRRARNLDDIIGASAISGDRYAVSYRLLRLSVLWAIELYKPEEQFLLKIKADPRLGIQPINRFKLGVMHAQMMLSLYDLAPQHDTKLELSRESLKLLANDMNGDIVARQAAAHVVTKTFVYLNEIEKRKPGNTLEGLALYREVNDFIRERLSEVQGLVKDLGLDTIPGIPTMGSFQKQDKEKRTAGLKGPAVLVVKEMDGKKATFVGVNTTGDYKKITWLRENNVAVSDGTATIDGVKDGVPLYFENDCFHTEKGDRICKGDSVKGEHKNGSTISGTVNYVFSSVSSASVVQNDDIYVEVKIQDNEFDEAYAIWNASWFKKVK
ncbi:MAG: hypothetical protein AB7F59_11650 [Bdellovibrionales bacterium]